MTDTKLPLTAPEIGERIYVLNALSVPYVTGQAPVVERIEDAGRTLYCKFEAFTDKDGTYRPADTWYVHDWIAAGDRVTGSNIPGYRGVAQDVTVKKILREGNGRPYFRADFDVAGRTHELNFYDAVKVAPVEPDADPEVTRLKASVERLTQQVADLRRVYAHDMEHWERTMRDVKTEQSWCDEGTNEIIERLNDGFLNWTLEGYETEFTFEVTVTGTLTTSKRVTVSATSEDAARDMVNESPEDYLDESADDLLTAAARSVSFADVEIEVED